MTGGFTRFVANLDCEEHWARADAAERRSRGEDAPNPSDPRFASRPSVTARVSVLATLCRVFLEHDDDRLWTPAPVSPEAVCPADGIPRPRMESGPLDRLDPVPRMLAWGDDGEAAVRANDRAFAHALAERAGCALAGARLVRSVEELTDALEGGGLSLASGERWVLKAPFSAAGRLRVLGRGRSPGPSESAHARRLLDLHGRALFEPWVDREQDFGVFVPVGGSPPSFHRTLTDDAGHFAGIASPSADSSAAGLTGAEAAELRRVAAAAAGVLAATGYAGPFGIDAYRYRTPRGEVRFRALGEINARHTFGAVAFAAASRILPGVTETCTLRIGPAPAPPASSTCVPLLTGGAPDSVAAWVSLSERGCRI